MAADAGGSGVERHVQSFLETLAKSGGQPIETLAPVDARQVLIDVQKDTPLPPADVSEKTIAANGQPLKLTIVRPKGAKGVLPGFMFFHGGGWILGSYQDHERFVRDLVVDSGQEAIFVNYSPSPEAHYPTAINQAYAATKWVSEHGEQIGVNGKNLAVVGNSVGGNMAAVVALKAKENGNPHLRAQILFWPVTNASFENASYDQFANGYFLSKGMMKWFWDAYTTDPKERAEIYASPLLASTEQLKGLPPALIETAGDDVLRDEGEAYANKLDAAGVDVVAVRYTQMIHDYGLLNALAQVPAVRAGLHQASEELKRSLQH
ncbi:MAG TPA: alpha/beta hydrolase [Rudaea sp.]|nr:alpha/beta hydrolase [Rudaea sp.]